MPYLKLMSVVNRSWLIVHGKKNQPITHIPYTINQKRGFTLIEILIAISIIAILSAVGLVAFSQAQLTSRDARRKQDLRAIAVALELYYQVNRAYPVTGGAPCTVSGGWCRSDGADPWIPALTTNYINALPHEPGNMAADPWGQSNSPSGYAYYSADCATWIGGQFYYLVGGLENKSDPDRNQVKQAKWCDGSNTFTGYGWKYSYVLSSR